MRLILGDHRENEGLPVNGGKQEQLLFPLPYAIQKAFKEAKSGPHASKWTAAMNTEYISPIENRIC